MSQQRNVLKVLGFTIDPERCALRAADHDIKLRPKSFDVLHHLVQNAGRLVRREELIDTLWPGVIVTEDSLTQCVSEVRQALSDQEHKIIKTVARRGYLFAAPVEQIICRDEHVHQAAASPTKQELEPAPIRCSKCGAENYRSAGFCCACGASLMPGDPPPARTDPEQRPLTILFCDLASPTAHSGGLDPEDLNEVTCAYHARIEDVIVSYGGVAVRRQSDGVLTYFGYPQADESDAERAVRAGLAVIEAVGNLRGANRFDLVARIGIATGLVITAKRDTDGAEVIGEAPTLARRLSAAAEPSAVVIAPSTHAIVKRLFEYRDLVLEFPGIADPVPALQVVGGSDAASRLEALHQFDASSLVGRQDEINLLLRRWDQARSGVGHVVLVTGEPGIGKSKLVLSMQEHLSCEHTQLVYGCSPIHQASALYPIVAQLLRMAGIRSRDSAETKLSKLQGLAATLNEASPDDDMALLAALLSIPVGDRYRLSAQPPERARQLTLRLLLDQIRRHATRRPILMVFEDLQWADPTSLELLSLIIEAIPGLPVLLIITFRSEFKASWAGQPHVTTLLLSRLGRSDSARIIAGVARGKDLPEPTVERILERTDGVPLFIEELTSTLLESGVLHETTDSYVLDAPLPQLAIPMTLRASLIARLDRHAAVKEVAQIGAAIGREFSYELIRAVAPLTTMDLEAGLGRSIASGLISCRGTPPEATYVFKHALIQDAAYSSLVRSRKQHLHRIIAQVIQERFLEIVATEPETVAHHCAAADMLETAIDFWVKAGDNCLNRFAYPEATNHLKQAVTLLRRLTKTPQTTERELEILLKMVSPLIAIKGPGSQEVETLYLRARALIDELGDTAQRYPVLWGLWFAHFIRGEYGAAQEAGATLLETAKTSGDEGQILEAHHALWALLSVRGKTLEAIEHMRRGSELYDQKMHASQALLYAGHDPGVCCRYHLAKDLWVTGRLEDSLHALDGALQLADRLKHPVTTAVALLYAAWVHYQRRDRPAMREVLTQLVSLTTEHNLVPTGEMAQVMQRVDECSDRLTLIKLHAKFIAARSAAQATNWHREFCIFMMAERCLELGYPEDGITFLASISTAELEGFYGPEIYRLEGELRLQLPNQDSSAIERCFRTALSRAKQASAKSLELRAATSLARYLREDGKPSDALNILVPIYECFSGSHDLQDIQNAHSLINDIQTSNGYPRDEGIVRSF